ncbi:MAG: hypothetical protein HRU19_02970 [Pseudobacteriovorax sp.]|nr:hypothetical protein [Pseudobacteriovorax sp.]
MSEYIETIDEFDFKISLSDSDAEHESVTYFLMTIGQRSINENDEETWKEVGEISGYLVSEDFAYDSTLYHACDAISGDIEEIASMIQDLENSNTGNFHEIRLHGQGYTIISSIHFWGKWVRTGIEQAAVGSLLKRLAVYTHGAIVYPLKETKDKDGIYATKGYDQSKPATAYIQKVFKDVGFEPVEKTKFWAFWNTDEIDLSQIPSINTFVLTDTKFEVDENELIEYIPHKIDSSNVSLFRSFENDLVYEIAERLRVSPESIARNYSEFPNMENSELLKYAKDTGVDPIEVIKRDQALRNSITNEPGDSGTPKGT